MTAITLRRADASRNMHRFYRPDVQRDLYGQWCCVREWGSTGHTSSVPHPTPEAADCAERRQMATRRKGYA